MLEDDVNNTKCERSDPNLPPISKILKVLFVYSYPRELIPVGKRFLKIKISKRLIVDTNYKSTAVKLLYLIYLDNEKYSEPHLAPEVVGTSGLISMGSGGGTM